jgi:hypothetical protein
LIIDYKLLNSLAISKDMFGNIKTRTLRNLHVV